MTALARRVLPPCAPVGHAIPHAPLMHDGRLYIQRLIRDGDAAIKRDQGAQRGNHGGIVHATGAVLGQRDAAGRVGLRGVEVHVHVEHNALGGDLVPTVAGRERQAANGGRNTARLLSEPRQQLRLKANVGVLGGAASARAFRPARTTFLRHLHDIIIAHFQCQSIPSVLTHPFVMDTLNMDRPLRMDYSTETHVKRKKPSIEQAATPCACCGYPLSQRHHLLPFAQWGEVAITVQLCPNCHAFYHLIDKVGDELPSSNDTRGRLIAWAQMYRLEQLRPDDARWLRGLWARLQCVLFEYEETGHASREAWDAVEIWAKRQPRISEEAP